MADTESAGIAKNAQVARPINIERFIGVSLSQPQQRRLRIMLPPCKSSPGWRLETSTKKISWLAGQVYFDITS